MAPEVAPVRPGEEIDVDEIVEPQARLLEQWVEIKDNARQQLEQPISSTTVAEALLLDYEEILSGGQNNQDG